MCTYVPYMYMNEIVECYPLVKGTSSALAKACIIEFLEVPCHTEGGDTMYAHTYINAKE